MKLGARNCLLQLHFTSLCIPISDVNVLFYLSLAASCCIPCCVLGGLVMSDEIVTAAGCVGFFPCHYFSADFGISPFAFFPIS